MKKLKIGLIVDDTKQSYLNYDLYRKSLESDHYHIEILIVQQPFKTQNRSIAAKALEYIKKRGPKQFFAEAALSFVEKIETQIVKRNTTFKDCFSLHPLSEFKTPKIYVAPVVSESGLEYTYEESDLEKLRTLGLDALVLGCSGILQGKILNICPFGVISLHHANSDIYRGGPSGFWEVFNREASTGFTIQRLSGELGGGDVLLKGSIPTSFLYKQNICKLHIKSTVFLHNILEGLAKNRQYPSIHPKHPYCHPLYTTPTIFQTAKYLLKTFKYGSKKVAGKLAGKTFRWSVAYQFTDEWQSAALWKSHIIKNPTNRFLADPFVITRNDQTVIFAEDFDYRTGLGKISAYEISSSGSKELGVALEEPYHLSYPFLLCVGDDLYMIPETHQSGEIRIYRSVDFPLRWELHKVIMKGVSAADTNIFKLRERYWMMTNLDSSDLGDHGSELHIFSADTFDSTHWTPHPMNPVVFDSKCGRNGGLFFHENEVYRVFQVQGFDMYGAAMGIAKIIVLDAEQYEEKILCDIPAKFMKDIRGAHTFSFDAGVLCIDFVKYENFRK